MPPGPAYNWFCVAHSIYDILSHAAQIRAAQVTRAGGAVAAAVPSRKRKRDESYPPYRDVTWEERVGRSTHSEVVRGGTVGQETSDPPSAAGAPAPSSAVSAEKIEVCSAHSGMTVLWILNLLSSCLNAFRPNPSLQRAGPLHLYHLLRLRWAQLQHQQASSQSLQLHQAMSMPLEELP